MAKINNRIEYDLILSLDEFNMIKYILNHFNNERGETSGESKELEKLIDDLEA